MKQRAGMHSRKLRLLKGEVPRKWLVRAPGSAPAIFVNGPTRG